MADWTQLPKELLDLISKHLDASFDVIRFRSVCSTWRSTVISPERHRLAPLFPVIPDDGGILDTSFGFSLSKRTVFLFGSPKTNIQTDPSTSWVIKIEEDVPNNRIQLLNPLSRTVLVGLDFEISVVGVPVFGGDKKFLVESKGELLLVDMYLSIEADEGSWVGLGFVEEYFENLAFYMNERTVRFKVFKLDEVGKEWVEVKHLDDRVLFLGDDCTFAASVEDLSVCRGNCIIFADNFFYSLGAQDGPSEHCDVGVFDLENGSIGPLQKFPQFSKLFWPPPCWISSTTLDVSILLCIVEILVEFLCTFNSLCCCNFNEDSLSVGSPELRGNMERTSPKS
ncbi:hypothetical protein CRYUN_Cryun10bG0149000 [Craigia yunnanensis]